MLLGRKVVEIKKRRRLQKPDTNNNISLELDMFILLH